MCYTRQQYKNRMDKIDAIRAEIKALQEELKAVQEDVKSDMIAPEMDFGDFKVVLNVTVSMLFDADRFIAAYGEDVYNSFKTKESPRETLKRVYPKKRK